MLPLYIGVGMLLGLILIAVACYLLKLNDPPSDDLVRLCSECLYCKPYDGQNFPDAFSQCVHPSRGPDVVRKLSLVTGELTAEPIINFCRTERESGKCGKKGRHWIRKPYAPQNDKESRTQSRPTDSTS